MAMGVGAFLLLSSRLFCKPPWNLKVHEKALCKSLSDDSIIDKPQAAWVQIPPYPLLTS